MGLSGSLVTWSHCPGHEALPVSDYTSWCCSGVWWRPGHNQSAHCTMGNLEELGRSFRIYVFGLNLYIEKGLDNQEPMVHIFLLRKVPYTLEKASRGYTSCVCLWSHSALPLPLSAQSSHLCLWCEDTGPGSPGHATLTAHTQHNGFSRHSRARHMGGGWGWREGEIYI